MNRKKIGHIINTFGLKGMVKVSISCTNPEIRFAPKSKVTILNEENNEEEYEISSLIIKNKRIVYIGFTKYNNINQVLFMKERDVFSEISLDSNTYFYDDLVSLSIYNENNKELGKVTNVIDMPAGDYLLIDNKVLIPFKINIFIKEVDISNKKIILTPLGLETYIAGNEN